MSGVSRPKTKRHCSQLMGKKRSDGEKDKGKVLDARPGIQKKKKKSGRESECSLIKFFNIRKLNFSEYFLHREREHVGI